MKKKKEISVFDLNTTASSTDCTGLIRLIPETDEEYAAYHELYDYGPTPDNPDVEPFADTEKS